jgi:hydroxyisourate hydrolase
VTNRDGRTDTPLATDLAPGAYELVFAVVDYFKLAAVDALFTEIPVRFRIDDSNGRYHVPLLLSPWGYSTYRGS